MVLVRQRRSPLLVLLAGTAVESFLLGETTSAVILASSIGVGFVNECRAAQALHTRIRHTVVALREWQPEEVNVTDLVPGDIVRLQMVAIVPADLRLLDAVGLQRDESMLTGESVPVDKNTEPMDGPRTVADLPNCTLMGTIVRAGTGVVVATGGQAEFGRIALALVLGSRRPISRLGC